MKITSTNGSRRQIASAGVWTDSGILVGRIFVSTQNPAKYCRIHPTGKHGRNYAELCAEAMRLDAAIATAEGRSA